MSQFISAVILAAGSSRRLGRPKQLLPIGETTFLERTVDNILDSSVSEVIVVVNPDYRQGMSTSVLAGLKSVSLSSVVKAW